MENSHDIHAHQPDWETWLNFRFYEDACAVHPKQYNTVCCGACTERPVCPKCWDSDNNHAGHQPVLRVRRASSRAAIDVENIKEFLDTSQIQVYSINRKTIVFLNPDRAAGASKEIADTENPTCVTCLRRLIKPTSNSNHYRFCSIACKILRHKQGYVQEIRPRIILKLKLKRKNTDQSSPSPRKISKRKSEIPHRAPFY